MPEISRRELKQVWGSIIRPMEPAYIYERDRELAMEEFEATVAELTAALEDLPEGMCAQFGVSEAQGVVWSFWLAREREPRLLWASGTREAVFEDAIDPTRYDGISMRDAQIATRLIRQWLVSDQRTTARYPVATLSEARERLATQQL
ncbi:hypothetical protein ACXIVK_27805 [Paraburkholderia caledonica]